MRALTPKSKQLQSISAAHVFGTRLAIVFLRHHSRRHGMHIVVCIKQVPDSGQIRVHPVTNTIMRQGVPTIINPYDLFALEQALRLRDQHGGEVTVLTMGPPMAEDSLRKALTFGADRAVLLTDRFFAGSDTLATSFALSSAIAKISATWGKPDIVFTGKQTIDGDTAQVGPGIAKRLDLNQLTYVSKISNVDLEGGAITVERRAEGGVQILKTRLPCLVTMLEGTNDMRRGTMADAFRAARAEVVKWTAAEAGITDLAKCGLKGSPTVVKRVFAPSARAEKAHIIDVSTLKNDEAGEALMLEIFNRLPALEDELQKMAAGY
jgi:electron transfer flavoprotein beta subunit